MKFVVEGKEIEISDSLLMVAGAHAEERGMMVYPLSEAAWKIITDNF